jgi:hypothetical protein
MKNFLRSFSLMFIFGAFIFTVQGQYFENPPKKESFKDKLFFGGGLGLQFGQVTLIDVSPIIGYKLTNRLQPGIGLTYSYCNYKTNNIPIEYSTYGGNVFTRFFLFDNIFAHVEAEYLNIKVYTFSGSSYRTNRQWIDSYLVGAGYFQKMGERGGISFTVLWNLNESELSPYTNPILRIGFNF